MSQPKSVTWKLDPHTKAKHEILQRYLGAWYPILCNTNERVIFIDGFSGPGIYSGGEPGSPIIALRAAIEHLANLQNELIFRFYDDILERVKCLEEEISKLEIPPNYNVVAEHGKFSDKILKPLEYLESQVNKPIPTFVFIDPFGFKDVRFDIIRRLLNLQKCEVLINFNISGMRRNIDHDDPKTKEHVHNYFDDNDIFEVIDKYGYKENILRTFYQKKLEDEAQFVRYFGMENRTGITVYYLFFASNNSLGHKKMKEAMWRSDPTGEYRFSDRTDENQTIMLIEETVTSNLSTILLNEFKSFGYIDSEEITKYVDDKTPFLEKHKNITLREMENEVRIVVLPENQLTGKKRRKNSYPSGTMIKFINNIL
ncbi:MAG: three-Cys-motif partner protein TcmP [Candidatus Electryonea clarkiae]|nr:three-Cys-motif partner protein TcmP [Candidatus Electryonea clarkiae]MDP8289340.1 three-Cys-motif partner protein TcmP [Candidatus Electryonea clarkiae]